MPRVLIAEPSPEVRVLLVRMLERLGHEPVTAEDAERAGHAPAPDVLLLEPDSERHLRLAHTLRGSTPDLPIVVCSIRPPSTETLALGPVRHLLKPFLRSDLAAALELACPAG